MPCLFQGFVADLLGMDAQIADGAGGALSAQPVEEMCNFDINDLLGLLGGFLAGAQIFFDGAARRDRP